MRHAVRQQYIHVLLDGQAICPGNIKVSFTLTKKKESNREAGWKRKNVFKLLKIVVQKSSVSRVTKDSLCESQLKQEAFQILEF